MLLTVLNFHSINVKKKDIELWKCVKRTCKFHCTNENEIIIEKIITFNYNCDKTNKKPGRQYRLNNFKTKSSRKSLQKAIFHKNVFYFSRTQLTQCDF